MIRHRPKVFIAAALFLWMACSPFGEIVAADGTENDYRRAESIFKQLSKDSKKKKVRQNWVVCIEKFKAVYFSQPDGPRADDALFMVGKLYTYLYQYSGSLSDQREAVDFYQRLLKRFPKTPFAEEARKAVSIIESGVQAAKDEDGKETPVVKQGVVKDRSLIAKKEEKSTPANGKSDNTLAEVENLRVWSSPHYTRIVIDVGDEVDYSYRLLNEDLAIGKPRRLYIDMKRSRMGSDVQPIVPIGDDLLSNARAAQYSPDTVRVVVDIKSIDTYKIFSLSNPFRVVLDVNGSSKNEPVSPSVSPGNTAGLPGEVPQGTLARQLALGVRRIVIDPGHGGKDPGAIGYDKQVQEKDVTLNIARRLQKKIREKLGIEAVLTRDKDIFLTLEERTAIANTKNGDLFISIHANASRNRHMRGIETYFLNLATDEEAIAVAARENATSEKNISDLEAILNDLMKNAKINESSRLASSVQESMATELRKKYSDLMDHGVKQAPFYVLLGSKMPSILVEVSFISNAVECRRLQTVGYQDALAEALVVGIENYIQALHPGAPVQDVRREA